MYADFNYYTNEYLGNVIDVDSFDRVATKASRYIDTYTHGKAKENADMQEVKDAMCAIAEQYFIIDKSTVAVVSEDGEVESQTVGGYSVRYRSGAERTADAMNQIAKLARQYLASTGLLYRGCRTCTDLIL